MGGEAEGYHGAFFALTASVDHVLPHSAGGSNEAQNLVTACWPCQFGRGAYTIEELGLSDPRLRSPVVDDWDGLCRVIGCAPAGAVNPGSVPTPKRHVPAVSATEWLSRLDGHHSASSRRLLDLVDSWHDLDVTWSLNKVLLVRMKVGGITIEFMAVEPNGDVKLPWSIGGEKDLFRGFAERLAEGIPVAEVYETPKLWNVSKANKKSLNILELLDASATIRPALVLLNTAMTAAAKTF
jgi:hypothetical protein